MTVVQVLPALAELTIAPLSVATRSRPESADAATGAPGVWPARRHDLPASSLVEISPSTATASMRRSVGQTTSAGSPGSSVFHRPRRRSCTPRSSAGEQAGRTLGAHGETEHVAVDLDAVPGHPAIARAQQTTSVIARNLVAGDRQGVKVRLARERERFPAATAVDGLDQPEVRRTARFRMSGVPGGQVATLAGDREAHQVIAHRPDARRTARVDPPQAVVGSREHVAVDDGESVDVGGAGSAVGVDAALALG